jgi:hypothetical protein
MKKFIIFFLMVFLFLGNSQARSGSTVAVADVGKTPTVKELISLHAPNVLMATPAPAPGIVVLAVGPELACPDERVTFTAVVQNPDTAVNFIYQWLVDGQYVTGRNDQVFRFRADSIGRGYHTISVLATADGCAPVYSQSAPIFITLPEVTITADRAQICSGGLVTFTAHLSDYNLPLLTYQWYKNGDTIPGATQITYATPITDELDEYSLVVMQLPHGCTDTVIAPAVEILDFNGLVDIATLHAAANTICEGGQVFLTATVDGAVVDSGFYYTWYRNGFLIPGVSGPTFAENLTTPDGDSTIYVYSVKLEIAGCDWSSLFISDTVVVVRNPMVVIWGEHHYCDNEMDFMSGMHPNNVFLGAWVDGEEMHQDLFKWYIEGQWEMSWTQYQYEGYWGPSTEPYTAIVEFANSNGCSAFSAPFQFYVHQTPVLNITAPEMEVCVGAQVLLTGHLNNYNEEQLTFQWYNDPIDNDAHIIQGATDIFYLATIVEGDNYFSNYMTQLSSHCTAHDNILIIGRPLPVIDSITTNDLNTICQGREIVFTAHSSLGVTGGEVYTWYKNGVVVEGAHDAVFIDVPVTVDNDITTIVYNVTVQQSASACVSVLDPTDEITIIVKPNPTVAIEGDGIVCQETAGNIHLVANVVPTTPATGDYTYQWYLDNVLLQDGLDNFYDATQTYRDYAYLYHVVVSNDYGCSVASEVFPVLVNASPVVTIVADENTICETGHVTLTAFLNDYNMDMLTYQWYKDFIDAANLIPGATSSTYTTEDLNTTTTFWVVVNQLTSLCTTPDDITITVVPKPVIDNVSLSVYEICEGGQVTVTATVDGSTGVLNEPFTFTWFKNGFLMEGVTSYTFVDAPFTNDEDNTVVTYSATVSQPVSGCVSDEVAADVLNVYRNPRVMIQGDHHICETDSVFLVANVDTTSRPVGLLHYTWYESGQIRDNLSYENGLGQFGDSKYFAEYFYPSESPYVFQVEVTRENGCTTMSDPFYVWVYQAPVVNITVSEPAICVGGDALLTAHLNDYNPALIGTSNYITYQWFTIDTIVTPIIWGGVTVDTLYTRVETIIPGATDRTYFATNLQDTTRFGVKVVHTLSDCFDIDEFEIIVVPIPVIDSVYLTQGNDTICEGQQITLNANVLGGLSGGGVFTWFRNGSLITGINGSQFSDNPWTIDNEITSFLYQVLVRQIPSGCISLTDTFNTTIVIFPNPSVEVAGDQIVCEETRHNIVLSANVFTPAPPAGTYTYTWFENNLEFVFGPDDSLSVTGDTIYITKPYQEYPYSFSVRVTNEFSCEVESDSYLVYVNDLPIIHTDATENEICVGGEITVFAHLANWNADELELQWLHKFNGVIDTIPVGTSLDYTTVLTQPGEHQYFFRVYQRSSGCLAYSDTTTINVHEDPIINVLNITDGADVICEGRQVTIVATITGGVDGGEIYTWYRNSEIVPGFITNIITDNPMTVDNELTNYLYQVHATQSAAGCATGSFSAQQLVTVHPNPTVVIAFDPIVCVETTNNITLTANVNPDIAANGDYHYTWYEDNAVIDNNDVRILSISRPFREYSYNFHVEVANEYGCSTISDVISIIVNDEPVVAIDATETLICTGGEVTIFGHLENWNADELELQWYHKFNGVITEIPVGTSINYNTVLTDTGAHQFFFEVYQRTSSCIAYSDTVTVTVRPLPIVSVAVVVNPVVCDGGQSSLLATVTNSTPDMGSPIFTWYQNGVIIPFATTNSLTVSNLTIDGDFTEYYYSATVLFTASGCESLMSNVDTVTVTPTPTVTISADRSLTYCEGGNVDLTANVDPEGTGYSYQWYIDNVLIQGANNSTINSSLPARETPYQYHVIITSLPGCELVSAVTYVTVVADPDVTVTVDNATICEGGVSTFTAHVEGGVSNVNGLGNYTYLWFSNVAGYSDTLGNQATYTTLPTLAPGTYTYFVEVTSPYGCQTVAYYTNFTVVADPVVVIDIAAGYDETICNGGNTMLIANVTGGLGTTSYQWYKNGVILPGETNQVLATGALYYGNDANNTFTVHVTQTGVDCSSWSETFTVTVLPALSVEVTGYANVCLGGLVTLTAEVTPDVAGNVLTYQWFRNGQPIYGATSSQYTTETTLLVGEYEYYVVAIGSISGCSIATSGTVQANVVADPIVTIFGNHSVCQNEALILHADVTGGVAGVDYTYTWSWRDENNVLQSAQTLVPDFTIPTLPANEAANPYFFTVSIARTDNTGCNATSVPYQVDVKQVPTVHIVFDYNTVCVGGTVLATANVAPLGTQYNYEWTINGTPAYGAIANQLVLNENNLQLNDNQIGLTVRPVGTINTCAGSDMQVVVVVPDPVIESGAIIANYTDLCVGGNIILNLDETLVTIGNGINASIVDYQWTISGIEIPGAIQPTFQTVINAPGVYNYNVRVTLDNFGHLGCRSAFSQPITITVAPQPDLQILRTDATANLDVCVGASVEFTAFINNPNPVYGTPTYTWQVSHSQAGVNIPNSNANPYTLLLDHVGTYTYNATASFTGYNCAASSSPIAVNVVNVPAWTDIDVVFNGNGNVCEGERVFLYADVQGGVRDAVGNPSGVIQWFVNVDGNIRPVTGNIGGFSFDDVLVPGTYTYFVTYTGNIGAGCELAAYTVISTNGEIAPATIIVRERPSAQFDTTDVTICISDDKVCLPITFTAGTAPWTIVLENTTTGEFTQFGPIYEEHFIACIVPPTQTSNYRISILTDKYGCDAVNLNSVATIRVNVSNVSMPNTFITGCQSPVNGNFEYFLPLTILDPTYHPVHYSVVFNDGTTEWNLTNELIDYSYTHSQSPVIRIILPTVPNDYVLQITIENGCVFYVIGTVMVNDADGLFSTLVEQRWDDVLVVNNNPNTNGGYEFYSYQWYRNGVLIPGAVGQYYHEEGGLLDAAYSVVLSGNRFVQTYDSLTNTWHTDTISVHYTSCDYIPTVIHTMKVYPVPATVGQSVTIEVNLTDKQLNGAVLDIFDSKGAHVKTIKDVQPITNIEGFTTQGVYFGRITTGTNEMKTVKFVIVK